jgi:hypothetical protein
MIPEAFVVGLTGFEPATSTPPATDEPRVPAQDVDATTTFALRMSCFQFSSVSPTFLAINSRWMLAGTMS